MNKIEERSREHGDGSKEIIQHEKQREGTEKVSRALGSSGIKSKAVTWM